MQKLLSINLKNKLLTYINYQLINDHDYENILINNKYQLLIKIIKTKYLFNTVYYLVQINNHYYIINNINDKIILFK